MDKKYPILKKEVIIVIGVGSLSSVDARILMTDDFPYEKESVPYVPIEKKFIISHVFQGNDTEALVCLSYQSEKEKEIPSSTFFILNGKDKKALFITKKAPAEQARPPPL